ncbi:hypothetical protein LUZ60_013669 [Juncus effusus]|nr:hypothetical protein LUZ60_013669 [Juncus effusus]
MGERQLVVAVETTGAVGPYWNSFISDYIEKIVRSFHANEVSGQRSAGPPAEFSMVIFNSHSNNNCFMWQRTGWTRNPDYYLSWLAGVHFSGGGFSDSCIAEGLSETLIMLYDETKGQVSVGNDVVSKHCVLVCASNPYALPTPVYRPKVLAGEEMMDGGHPSLADAETLARCFPHCGISLSVISPKQLPALRTIFNAARRNPRGGDSSADQVKHGQNLVLVSESFLEARSALNQPVNGPVNGNTVANPIVLKQDGPVTPPVPVTQNPNPSVNNPSLMNRPIAAPTNIKVEPVTGPGFPHPPTQPIAPPQISQDNPTNPPSNPSIMQNTPSNPNNPINTPPQISDPIMQDLKPSQMSSSAQPVRPAGPTAPANVSILNNISQLHQGGATTIGMPTIGGPTPIAVHMSNLMSGTRAGTVAGTGMAGSFNNPSASLGNNPSNNLQGMGQMGQGGSSGMMMGNQTGVSGVTGLGSGPGSMMNQQQAGGMSQMSMQQHPNAQQSQSKYVKIWEGTLSGQRQGQPVFICKLEGYRSASASDTLAADWPATMQIVRLIAQEHMNNKQYVGKADFLVFRTLNQHGFLGQLQEKKLCAVIQLPSQTLLLSVSDKAGRLIGMLFPGVITL